MLVSSKYKFIFFHVPKVAGSSLTKALRKHSNWPSERLNNYAIDYLGQIPRLGLFHRHIKPAEVKKLMGAKKFDSYYKFAFVRNTYDWHVSQYSFHLKNVNGPYYKILRNKSFEEYVQWTVQHLEHTNSMQYDFLSDANGQLLVDFIGRFEDLGQDFEVLKKKLGIDANLPHANSSERNVSYREYYSKASKEIVDEVYAKDIEYFGFDF